MVIKMKIDMQLALKDVPGSLLRALEPISSHGGNIISVLHSRGEKERVEVKVTFKIADQESLDLIRKEMEKRGIQVSDIRVEGKRYYSKKILSFILVGHVIDTDVRDTIDRINEVGLVSDIDVVMPSPEQKSSVMMSVEVDNGKLERLNSTVEKVCTEKDLLLISSIE